MVDRRGYSREYVRVHGFPSPFFPRRAPHTHRPYAPTSCTVPSTHPPRRRRRQANVDGAADIGTGQQVLDKREFMLCLAIGYVIGIIPLISSPKSSVGASAASASVSVAQPAAVEAIDSVDLRLGDDVLEGSSQEIHDVMQIIVETYLIFDRCVPRRTALHAFVYMGAILPSC